MRDIKAENEVFETRLWYDRGKTKAKVLEIGFLNVYYNLVVNQSEYICQLFKIIKLIHINNELPILLHKLIIGNQFPFFWRYFTDCVDQIH